MQYVCFVVYVNIFSNLYAKKQSKQNKYLTAGMDNIIYGLHFLNSVLNLKTTVADVYLPVSTKRNKKFK